MGPEATERWLGPASRLVRAARFNDAEFEARYRLQTLAEDQRAAIWCCAVLGLAFLAFMPTDWGLYGNSAMFYALLGLRVVYAAAGALAIWRLRRPLTPQRLDTVMRAWTALTIVTALLTNMTRPAGAVGVLATHLPLVLLIYTSVPLAHRDRLLFGWGFSLAFILIRALMAHESAAATWMAIAIGTLSIQVFGPAVSARAHLLGRQLAAATWEAEDLRHASYAAAGMSEFRYDLDSAARLHGHPIFEANGKPADVAAILAQIHPDDRAAVDAAYASARDTGSKLAIEYRVGGLHEWRWMRSMGAVVGRSADCRGELVGLTWDIHERRVAESAASAMHERLERALRRGRMVSWEWDLVSGRRQALGPQQELFGCAPRTIDVCAAMVHADDRDQDDALLHQALAENSEYINEFRIVRADGSVCWLHSRGQPVADASGTVVGIAGLAIDINARKVAELHVADLSNRLQLAVDAAKLNPWSVDLRTGTHRPGQRDVELFGATITSLAQFEALVLPEDLPIVARFGDDREFADGRSLSLEFRIRHPDGELRWIACTASRVCDAQGQPQQLVGMSYDITARKRDELELRAALNAAHRASEAKSAFLATMSHELRTPLNAVVGFAGLLLDSTLDDAQRIHARLLRSSSQQLLALIDKVLDFSRIEAGEMPLDAVRFVAEDCLQSAVDMVAAQAEAKGLCLALVVQGPVRRPLLGDVTRVRQIAINLLGNAIKFTEHGGVRCTLSVAECEGQASLQLRVADSGIGMSEEVRAHLFQPFRQGDASTTRRYGGTGLGLSICQRLAQLMGGTIEVSSQLGAGSEFVVTLPLRWAEQSEPALAASEIAAPAHADALPTAGQKARVLIAEDNAVNRMLLQVQVQSLGYAADAVSSGREALAALREPVHDIVLMDIEMPEMDGMETTRLIQVARAASGALPYVIAVTAHVMDDSRARFLAAGMDDYVSKPILIQTLSAALERATERLRTERR